MSTPRAVLSCMCTTRHGSELARRRPHTRTRGHAAACHAFNCSITLKLAGPQPRASAARHRHLCARPTRELAGALQRAMATPATSRDMADDGKSSITDGGLRVSTAAGAEGQTSSPPKSRAREHERLYLTPTHSLVQRVEVWVGDVVIVLAGSNEARTKFKLLRVDRDSGVQLHVRNASRHVSVRARFGPSRSRTPPLRHVTTILCERVPRD